jgi:hypothetical protein
LQIWKAIECSNKESYHISFKEVKKKYTTDLKESIFLTRGARGMSMKREFVKKAILLLASRFAGTSMADSLTVRRRYSLLIC